MTRQGFIEGLRRALTGKIDTVRLNEIIKYYEEFIMIEVRKGKREEEVLRQLGDPRLIAKSILAAESGGGEADISYRAEHTEEHSGQEDSLFAKFMRIPTWLKAVIIGLIVVLILALVFKLVIFLVPIVLPIAFVVWLIKYLKER